MNEGEKQKGCLSSARGEHRVHFREDYEAGLERQAEDEALQAMLRGMDFIPNKMGEHLHFPLNYSHKGKKGNKGRKSKEEKKRNKRKIKIRKLC